MGVVASFSGVSTVGLQTLGFQDASFLPNLRLLIDGGTNPKYERVGYMYTVLKDISNPSPHYVIDTRYIHNPGDFWDLKIGRFGGTQFFIWVVRWRDPGISWSFDVANG